MQGCRGTCGVVALMHLGGTRASKNGDAPGGYTLKGRQGHLGRRISRAAEARICFLMDGGVFGGGWFQGVLRGGFGCAYERCAVVWS